jgi:hypothetical protein
LHILKCLWTFFFQLQVLLEGFKALNHSSLFLRDHDFLIKDFSSIFSLLQANQMLFHSIFLNFHFLFSYLHLFVAENQAHYLNVEFASQNLFCITEVINLLDALIIEFFEASVLILHFNFMYAQVHHLFLQICDQDYP